jgi:Cys-rich repeat protein
VCRRGQCGDPCFSVLDCQSGDVHTCTAAGLCGACASDGDCSSGSRPRCVLSRGQCVACLSAADCPVDKPACALDGSCVECAADADCPGGSCDTGRGQCR